MTYYANQHVAKDDAILRARHATWTKIFAFSRHFPSYNRVSVTTNIKNSGLLVRIQDGDEENSASRRKLGRIKGNFAAALDGTENKLM